jgi:hypothetical protein
MIAFAFGIRLLFTVIAALMIVNYFLILMGGPSCVMPGIV